MDFVCDCANIGDAFVVVKSRPLVRVNNAINFFLVFFLDVGVVDQGKDKRLEKRSGCFSSAIHHDFTHPNDLFTRHTKFFLIPDQLFDVTSCLLVFFNRALALLVLRAIKLIINTADCNGKLFPVCPTFRNILQQPAEIDRRVRCRVSGFVVEFDSTEKNLYLQSFVFCDPSAIEQRNHDRRSCLTDMFEQVLWIFKDVEQEMRVFDLLRQQVSL